nr:hypothetical protein [uncultured Alloprevotella sp.]
MIINSKYTKKNNPLFRFLLKLFFEEKEELLIRIGVTVQENVKIDKIFFIVLADIFIASADILVVFENIIRIF